MKEGVHLIRASDGIIVYTNPRFDKMFGYELGELIDKHISIVDTSTKNDPEEVSKVIMNISVGAFYGESNYWDITY